MCELLAQLCHGAVVCPTQTGHKLKSFSAEIVLGCLHSALASFQRSVLSAHESSIIESCDDLERRPLQLNSMISGC